MNGMVPLQKEDEKEKLIVPHPEQPGVSVYCDKERGLGMIVTGKTALFAVAIVLIAIILGNVFLALRSDKTTFISSCIQLVDHTVNNIIDFFDHTINHSEEKSSADMGLEDVYLVKADVLNLRSSPKKDKKGKNIIEKMEKGKSVKRLDDQITEDKNGLKWVYVESMATKKKGYCALKYLKKYVPK